MTYPTVLGDVYAEKTQQEPAGRHVWFIGGVFEGWRVPPGFRSDACTFASDGHRNRYAWACVLHDFLRRYGAVPAADADAILYRHLRYLGASRLRASLYWLGAFALRGWFRSITPMPLAWLSYRQRVWQA